MHVPRTVLVAAAALTLAGCGQDEQSQAGSDTPEAVSVMIRLVTDSGNVAANADDTWCVWGQTPYTLRDGAGEIIATGDAESDTPGEAEAGGRTGLLGQVTSTDPYECTLKFTIPEVPRADFYELEVAPMAPRSGQTSYSTEAAFEAREALSGYYDVTVHG